MTKKPKRSKAIWTQLPQYRKRSIKSQRRLQRIRDKRQYTREARAFITAMLMNPSTQWCVIAALELKQAARVTQVHHFAGRIGKLLLWKHGWLAVSDIGHRWLHTHVKEAREKGWICPAGMWNNPKIMEQRQTP